MGRRTLPALPRPSFHTPFCSFLLFPPPSFLPCPSIPRPTPATPHATAPSYPLSALCVAPAVASLTDRSKTIASQPRPFTLTRAHASLWMVQIENPPPGFSVPGKVRRSAVRVPHGVCGPTRSLRVP